MAFFEADTNIYRYVRNRVVTLTDPYGEYAITWGAEFTAQERLRISQSLERLEQRVRRLMRQVAIELQRVERSCPCERNVTEPALRPLFGLLVVLHIQLISKTKLVIDRTSPWFFHRDAEAWADKTYFGDSQITFNDALAWRTMNLELFDRLLLHELSHLYGTGHEEHDVGPSPFMNAATFGRLRDLHSNAWYLRLRNRAKEACKAANCPVVQLPPDYRCGIHR